MKFHNKTRIHGKSSHILGNHFGYHRANIIHIHISDTSHNFPSIVHLVLHCLCMLVNKIQEVCEFVVYTICHFLTTVVHREYQVGTTGFSESVLYLTTMVLGKCDVGASDSNELFCYFITDSIVLTQTILQQYTFHEGLQHEQLSGILYLIISFYDYFIINYLIKCYNELVLYSETKTSFYLLFTYISHIAHHMVLVQVNLIVHFHNPQTCKHVYIYL